MKLKHPRVVFLSTTKLGIKMLNKLKKLKCEIVFSKTEGEKCGGLPPYDLGISFLYPHKISKTEFKFPHRWVNFHPGPLPEFRGRDLCYHAIMNQATHFGATIHYMDVNYDTGEIIEVIRFPILQEDTAGDLTRRSYKLLKFLFEKYIPRLLTSKVSSSPQEKGIYYSKEPIDEVVEINEEQGLKIRALTVHPRFNAKIKIGKKMYKIVPLRKKND